MLGYWCDFKISTDIDPKTNPKNEIVWKILVGKKSVWKILVGKKIRSLPKMV